MELLGLAVGYHGARYAGRAQRFNVHRSSAAAFCAVGWHVCTGAEINRGRGSNGTGVAYAAAKAFAGTYVYDANNDCKRTGRRFNFGKQRARVC